MELTEPVTLSANAVMQDDWVEVAGHMYRVLNITRNGMLTTFDMYDPDDPEIVCQVRANVLTPMSIRNQK
jgi:hypothetical protein